MRVNKDEHFLRRFMSNEQDRKSKGTIFTYFFINNNIGTKVMVYFGNAGTVCFQ